MIQDNQEPQSKEDMGDEDKESLIWGAITLTVTFLVGLLIGVAIGLAVGVAISQKPNEASTVLSPPANTTSMYQDDPGNFVILEDSTTSITFKGFEGELVWYESYEGSHFHPMGFATIENGKPIQIPEKAVAFLKKGKSIGETYQMDTSSSPTY